MKGVRCAGMHTGRRRRSSWRAETLGIHSHDRAHLAVAGVHSRRHCRWTPSNAELWARPMTDPDVPPPPFWPRKHDDQQVERARLVADFRRRLASTGPVVGHDDLGGLVRTMRSAARLSQRELAARSGVPERTLARIESEPDAGARWSTVTALLSGAGCRLQVLGPDGHPVVPWGWEAGLDEGGRHVPAHLSVSLPFDAIFHRRLSMVRLTPWLPLFRWSLRHRRAPTIIPPPTPGQPSSAPGDGDAGTPPEDGSMLRG